MISDENHFMPEDFDMMNHIYGISPIIQSTTIDITKIAADLEKVNAKKASGQMASHHVPYISLIKSSATGSLYLLFFNEVPN